MKSGKNSSKLFRCFIVVTSLVNLYICFCVYFRCTRNTLLRLFNNYFIYIRPYSGRKRGAAPWKRSAESYYPVRRPRDYDQYNRKAVPLERGCCCSEPGLRWHCRGPQPCYFRRNVCPQRTQPAEWRRRCIDSRQPTQLCNCRQWPHQHKRRQLPPRRVFKYACHHRLHPANA